MRYTGRLFALILALMPALAFGQTPPLPSHTVWGRLGIPGDTGPAQAIPFATLFSQLSGVQLPVVNNDLVCFNGTAGQLKDCGLGITNGGFILNPTAGLSQGFNITQSSGNLSTAGSANPCAGLSQASFLYNSICATDALNVTSGSPPYTYGFNVGLLTGGTNSQGTKVAFGATINHNVASTPSAGRDHIAGQFIAAASAGDGGTNTSSGAAGTNYSVGLVSQLNSGATNLFVTSAGEADCFINTGASAANRWCWSIVDGGNLQGAQSDAAVEIGSAGGPGFKTALYLDKTHGSNPLSTTGCVICTDGNAATITTGIDLSAYTISGNFLKGPGGFVVDGGANIGGVVTLAMTGNANNGFSITDGTVTGIIQPSTNFTHSLIIGTSSNHTVGIKVNNSVVGAFIGNTFWSGVGGAAGNVALQGALGCIELLGTSSGTATVCAPAAAGTPTITLGTSSGTPVVALGSNDTNINLALNATTGVLTPSWAGTLANSRLATMATNTIKGNATSGTAGPTDLAIGSCSTAASALIWTTNTGFGCNTSITAAAVPASGLTGTVAVANGGTGDTGTAWSTFSSTVTASATPGSFAATGAVRYKQLGKTILWHIDIAVTTLSTATGTINFTMPFTPNSTSWSGGVNKSTGILLSAYPQTAGVNLWSVSTATGTFPATGNGQFISLDGHYEST